MKNRLTIYIFFLVATLFFSLYVLETFGATPKSKSKFYDFSEQLVDGKINKPTTLYTDSRQKIKFDRLLNLKKSFFNSLYKTAKERIFK